VLEVAAVASADAGAEVSVWAWVFVAASALAGFIGFIDAVSRPARYYKRGGWAKLAWVLFEMTAWVTCLGLLAWPLHRYAMRRSGMVWGRGVGGSAGSPAGAWSSTGSSSTLDLPMPSHASRNCASCGGRGEQVCTGCSGTGSDSYYSDGRCRVCSGSGTRSCYPCGGRGVV
jgi:hypothetical protein